MAKSFKNIINEVYEPKSPDEKKFKDKHISKLFPNMFADSQYDKLFKGSTTEIDRGKDRHGYNPGEDEKVYEDTQLDETFHSGFDLFEKAMSVAQQKLMAIALRYKRDPESVPDASDSVKKLADSMTEKQLRDFAETKHKGLPKKVED